MKTFLKILLVAALLVIAIKLSPLLFLAALVGLLVAALLGVVGLSLLAGLAAVLLDFAVALSPVWIPVRAVIGLVHLWKRHHAAPAVTA